MRSVMRRRRLRGASADMCMPETCYISYYMPETCYYYTETCYCYTETVCVCKGKESDVQDGTRLSQRCESRWCPTDLRNAVRRGDGLCDSVFNACCSNLFSILTKISTKISIKNATKSLPNLYQISTKSLLNLYQNCYQIAAESTTNLIQNLHPNLLPNRHPMFTLYTLERDVSVQ